MSEYIARETLEAEIRRQMDECNPMSEGRFYGASFLATVECAAAADVAPVVHGEWKLLDECSNAGVYCSICHKAVYRESAWYKNVHIKSKYCPNCGAKMDKEDET